MCEQALAEKTGIGLERRLMGALASLDGLRNELLPVRRSRIREQLATLGVGPTSQDLQLHIGCGDGHLPGWINIDVHPAPLATNVLWGLPFADRSVSRVFVSHMLEHLFVPRDVGFFLGELKRVMAPGGVVRIVVPDIEQCIAAYVANDRSFFASRRETWSWWPENTTRLEDFLAYAGAMGRARLPFRGAQVRLRLRDAGESARRGGLRARKRSAYMASEDPALRVDEVSAVARAQYGERHYSLFVEARAPAR